MTTQSAGKRVLVLLLVGVFRLQAQTAPTAIVAPPLGQSAYPLVQTATGFFPASLALDLGWNESYRAGIQVPISNTGGAALTILGLQVSANLFIENFPSTVGAGGTGTITLIYFSRYNASGESDAIRVLTNLGEVDIPVAHTRMAAYHKDVKDLTWNVNDALTTQTVTLTMASGTTVPQAVTALGTGNTATLTPAGGLVYKIAVTPGSTATAGSFPVIVTLNPSLPGGPLVITCNITAAN
jgi:hypothetical protein